MYGRHVVQFNTAQLAELFVSEPRPFIATDSPTATRWLRRPSSGSGEVVLQDVGSDEQIGMRLHEAAVEWSLRHTGDVHVHRMLVLPCGRLNVVVRKVGE
jgi:hypothetical protein